MSAASLFFRDVKYIVDVVITFAIFFTPVLYEVSAFGKWGTWIMLNPVAPIMEGLYASVIEHTSPNIPWVCYSAVVSVVFLYGALRLFRKLEPIFAESI